MLNKWSTDKIIGAGLIVVALSAIIGAVIVTLVTGGESSLVTCAKEIGIGLAGYMGRGGVEKWMMADEAKQGKELGDGKS